VSRLFLRELEAPLLALRLLGTDYGGLPAPGVRVSTVYPDRLELDFHGDLAGFEAWREALGVAPGAVEYGEQGGGRTRVLRAQSSYAGADVVLTGYGDVPSTVTGAWTELGGRDGR
jgi:hypothetical protein